MAIARADAQRVIVTHRSSEKVKQSIDEGLQAIQFSLQDESSWDNLPEIFATVIITFELSWAADSERLQRLYKRLTSGNEKLEKLQPQVVALSTTSVFSDCGVMHAVVDEESPLTGVGVMGKPMDDRIKAEQYLIGQGCTVLALSGLVGPGREAANFMNWRPNGLALVNLVHVDDVCAAIRLVSAGVAKGRRIIVSSGAYKYNNWAEPLGLEPLPESPDQLDAKKTKRVCAAILVGLLPPGYQFVLPVPCVPPVAPASGTANP